MNDDEKVTTYLELYKIQMQRFNSTRDFEWKINIALWSSIIVATGFLVGKITVTVTSILVFLTIYLWHFLWMVQIQKHEDYDEHVMTEYQQQIEKLVGWKIPQPGSKVWFTRLPLIVSGGFWWVICETSATALLLVVAWLVLNNVPVSPH
jgi:hypothetical protein